MKKVFVILTQGKRAIVDEEDFEKVNKLKWYSHVRGYAMHDSTKNNKRTTILMHRLIMNAPNDKIVDHINGNTLDNRKSNLRFCTQSLNLANRNKSNTALFRYKGVYKNYNRWIAFAGKTGSKKYIGSFKTEIEAAKAYDKRAKELYGKFARLNLYD